MASKYQRNEEIAKAWRNNENWRNSLEEKLKKINGDNESEMAKGIEAASNEMVSSLENKMKKSRKRQCG
jgi:hypothetical protein